MDIFAEFNQGLKDLASTLGFLPPEDPGTITVYASIGNSDDKLSQQEWSDYLRAFRVCMNHHADQVYGDWVSEPSARYQNACMSITTDTPDDLRYALTAFRKRWSQDSIAFTVVPKTMFI
jgi:hypothetical protein